MSESFAVRIQLKTPISLKHLLHFDGLLAAASVRMHKPWDDIPLDKHEGVWQGSAAILEVGIHGPIYGEQPRLKKLTVSGDVDDLFTGLPRSQRRITDMSVWRNRLTYRPLHGSIKSVWFAGRGDAGRAVFLLERLPGIGAMSGTGYGEIESVESFTLPDDPMTGLVLNDLPARTFSLNYWDKTLRLPRPEFVSIGLARAEPPYFEGPRIECIEPIQISLSGTSREIWEMLEVAV